MEDNVDYTRVTENHVREILLPCVMGLYLCERVGGNVRVHAHGNNLGGGTALVIGTVESKVPLVLTCDHVLGHLEAKTRENNRLFIGVTINRWFHHFPKLYLFDRCADLDIACVGGIPEPIGCPPKGYKKKGFHARLPSEPVHVGDKVHALGFPGVCRDVMREDHVFLTMEVSSVNAHGFVCAPEAGGRVLTESASAFVDVNMHLGGMSGGPVFTLRNGQIELVGLVSEGQTAQDPVWVSSLQYMTGEGKIDRLTAPPLRPRGVDQSRGL